MRRRFYGNFWGAPFTERMIEFARGHRGVKRVLGELVAGDQGYVDLKKKPCEVHSSRSNRATAGTVGVLAC